MKKKILSIALALCMVLTMMPMATGVAWAAATSVKIGGVPMVSGDATTYYKVGNSTASTDVIADYDAMYVPSTGTLTLNGLVLQKGGITAEGDLTINLVEDNTLGNDVYDHCAINVDGDLTISGSGKLHAYNGKTVTTTIYASGSITINNSAKVTAVKAGGDAQAINAKGGDIVITDSATVVATNNGTRTRSYALLAGNIQSSSPSLKNIEVSNGATLTATQGGTGNTVTAVRGTVDSSINQIIIGGDSESAANSLTLDELNSDSNVYKYVYIVDSTGYSTVDAPSAEATMTYDGTVKTGVKEVTGYSLSDNTATDAGNYTATATLTSGYKWKDGTITPKKIQWSIAKADLNKDSFTFAAPSNCTYDGNAKAAMVTIKDGLTGIGNITVKYYDEAGNKVDEAKEVGTYTVKIDVAEGMNNNAATDLTDSSWTFAIVAPVYDVTITSTTGINHVSGSESQTGLTGAMTAVVYNAETGYYFPVGYGASLGQNGITVERVNETQIKISGTPTATTAITLTEPSQHPVKPSITVDGTYTYTGEEQTVSVTGYNQATMNIDGNKKTNAGSYTVSVTSKTGKWRDGTTDAVTASWLISPLSVTITPTSGLQKTYGEADPELTYSTGLSGAAETAFNSAKSGKLARAAGEDANSYVINIGTLNAGTNFTLTLSSTPVSFTIIKATWGVPTETLTPEAPTSAANNDGKIKGTKTGMEYKLSSDSTWNDCSGDVTGLAAGTYYVRYKADANHNASESVYKQVIVPAYSTGGSTGGGGSYIPPVQKPVIGQNDNVKTELSSDGTKLTIKVADGYEITDVLVNGVSKGKVTELTGLKTGDKVEVKTEKKQEEPKEPTKEEIVAALKEQQLVARSKLTTSKSGRKAVLITWYDKNGNEVTFDGVEIYRSTKRDSGYGDEPIFVSKTGKYYNTAITEGTRYYYKVRGYVIIDGQKYYTDYSLKAIRTIK